MIRGVIFDLDGVLVTTDDYHYRAWKAMADQEGIPFDRQTNERLRGVSRMDSLDIILEKAPRQYSDEEKQQLAERKNRMYRESLQELTRGALLPGALEMLHELQRRDIKIAVASSSKNTPLIMKRLGLNQEVDAVADGNDITRSKPHPEVFLIAAERLGLPPEEGLVVEDAAAGIEAGRRGGFAVFGIGPAERLPSVKHRAMTLAETTADELLAIEPGE
jgi:beta-phosphoglucomutase